LINAQIIMAHALEAIENRKFIPIYPHIWGFIHKKYRVIHRVYPQAMWISLESGGGLPVIDRLFDHIQKRVEGVQAGVEMVF